MKHPTRTAATFSQSTFGKNQASDKQDKRSRPKGPLSLRPEQNEDCNGNHSDAQRNQNRESKILPRHTRIIANR